MNLKSFHLVIRFSDNLFSIGDVVDRHNEVVSIYGYVWFGKFGSSISMQRLNLLRQQIAQGIPTNVYLVKGNRKKSTFYRAELLAIEKQLPTGEKNRFPEYYIEKELLRYIQTWFQITEIHPLENSAISIFKVVNSAYRLNETLDRSSSGYFLVHEIPDSL